jgi:hypothetical protein
MPLCVLLLIPYSPSSLFTPHPSHFTFEWPGNHPVTRNSFPSKFNPPFNTIFLIHAESEKAFRNGFIEA